MIRRTLIAAALLAATALSAQQVQTQPTKPTLRELTLENIFDPKAKVTFTGTPQSGFIWLDDHTYTWPRTDAEGKIVEQTVLDTTTGKTRPLFDAAKLQAAIAKVPGISPDEAKSMALQRSWNFSPNRRGVLLTLSNDIFVYDFDSGALSRLTSAPGDEEEATFSPDGRSVAFVRGNNLYTVDVATQRERQLTTDGGENTLNGILDWVYQEEIYGRGTFRSYWWSPDSARLAFLQLDERPVHRFTIPDHIPYRQNVEEELYPKAGDPNPTVKLFTVVASGGTPREISNEQYSGADFLIVNVDWTPDNKVIYQLTNREQTWLDLNVAEAKANATPKTLFRESTKAWVETQGNPVWLKDGSFLWLSERSGFKHLYQYKNDGTLVRQITTGPWEVRALHGIDPANEWIYFSGTERTVTAGDVYRVKLDGSGLKRLTDRAGNHSANFNPASTQFIDFWSDVETPPQVSLLRNDGTQVKVIDANESPTLRQYRLAKPEFVQVKTRDGFTMEAMLIKPPDFDPSKKYPVYEFTYSGPHAQQVRNAWSGRSYLWYQLLANRGIIVWVCDNRSASGKGAESAWAAYKNFGATELRDLEDGLKWLESQGYVDSSRVMLDGWSYGGFMTSYALTHSTMWAAGISGGTVADWRDYDTIYTERVMLMPQNNPDGYKNSSPRFAAKNLHGSLLLLHGAIDDNVHMQNMVQFAYELQKAGKQFRMMIYPKSRHGVGDPALVAHMRGLMLSFIDENLLGRGRSPATAQPSE
jgi:dipeptidyl-peptidase-4